MQFTYSLAQSRTKPKYNILSVTSPTQLYQDQDQDIRPQDQDTKWKSHYLHDREIDIEKVVWQTYFTKVRKRKKRAKHVRLSVCYASYTKQWACYWSTEHLSQEQDIRFQDQDQDIKNATQDHLETKTCLETFHPCILLCIGFKWWNLSPCKSFDCCQSGQSSQILWQLGSAVSQAPFLTCTILSKHAMCTFLRIHHPANKTTSLHIIFSKTENFVCRMTTCKALWNSLTFPRYFPTFRGILP